MRRSFPRQMASLQGIVAYLREFLAAEGLDEGVAYDVDLVLEELFTNLVKYGRGARGDVEITLSNEGGRVTAELREYDADSAHFCADNESHRECGSYESGSKTEYC